MTHKAALRRLTGLLLGVIVILVVGVGSGGKSKEAVRDSVAWLTKEKEDWKPMVPFDKTQVLNFVEPQDSWRVQVKSEVRYLTSLVYGGHANQMIGIFNLLTLGKMLNRVTIIPTLNPLHFDNADPRNLSDFFNITRYYHETQTPLIEWWDMKYGGWDEDAPPKEEMACWSLFEMVTKNRGGGCNPNDGPMRLYHNIHVSFWAMPDLLAGAEGFNVWFDALKTWDTYPAQQTTWLEKVRKEYLPQRDLPPGTTIEESKKLMNVKANFSPKSTRTPLEHPSMLCLDNSFFIGSNYLPPPFPTFPPPETLRSYEGEGWIESGQHLHFNDGIERLADEYLLAHFNVNQLAEVPPFITVHIRRGDFAEARGLTSIDKYTDGVSRVRKRLQARMDDPNGWTGAGKEHQRYWKNYKAKDYKVLATTDEDPESEFVKELKGFGWIVVDHGLMKTEEKYDDAWLPMIIDQALLARGRAFVGTEWSTYSYLAGLRVKYWNGGLEEWTPTV